MILDMPAYHWIYVVPSTCRFPIAYQGELLTKEEYEEHWGKWVIMDARQQLDELAAKLDPHIESRAIQSIKYTRSPEKVFGLDECVMCVFCDDREKDAVWDILASAGVKIRAWVYDREVFEMWKPGGVLIEQWLTSHGIEGEEAEKIREQTRENFEKWLSTIGEKGNGPWSFELI